MREIPNRGGNAVRIVYWAVVTVTVLGVMVVGLCMAAVTYVVVTSDGNVTWTSDGNCTHRLAHGEVGCR